MSDDQARRGQKMTEDLLKRKHSFTALVAFDDVTAFGAIRALTKAGLRVPEDCSVIGFDDVPAASLLFPSLTTVRQPMEAMGSSAVTMLVDEMNAAMENRDFSAVYRTLAPQLIMRESTRVLH